LLRIFYKHTELTLFVIQTTLSNAISETLGVNSTIHLTHESYYKSLPESYTSSPLLYNFDHPSSFETELLISHIHKLKQGLSVHIPTYDYITYQRIKNESKLMEPKRVIIVEGILVFSHTELVQELDVKIYIVSFKLLCYIQVPYITVTFIYHIIYILNINIFEKYTGHTS